MNKKLFRTVFAVFLAVFMCGTSINPAVFAIDNEPETETEEEEPKMEEGNDTKKVITGFELEDIPAEVKDAKELPDEIPATLEGEAAETADVAVEWTEKENTLTVDLASDSKNTYKLSKDAEGQLKDISVKKVETEEDEELAGEQKNAEGEDAEINKSDDNLSEKSSREGRTEEADFTKKAVKNGTDGDEPELNAPVVTWDGMSVKWDSVAGATSYEYKYYCQENPEITDTTTDTQLDLTNFIKEKVNERGSLYFGVKVKALNETTESDYSYYSYKTFHKITVRADTESISGETTTADGKSGTVSGNGFSEFDPETASISGIFEDNAEITVTAVPNEGYEFKSFDGPIVDVDEKTNPVQNLTVKYSSELWATFKELPSTLTVTLEMGSNHADLADSVLEKYLNGKDPDLYSGTVDGSLITLQIPNADEDGYFEVGDLQRELASDIQIASYGNVQGFFGVGKKTIDNYSDQREINEEAYSEDQIQNNQKFYALWAKPITDCTITALPLLCGTELSYGDDASEYIQCTPNNVRLRAVWMPEDEEPSEEEPKEGETITVIGDKKYNIGIEISAPFGYYIGVVDGKPNIKYSNVEEVQSGSFGPLVFVLGQVTAQHSMGDWTITKEPSFTEEGLKTRTCACKEKTETESISKVTYSVKAGNGQTWTKGSSGTADFEFSRSYKDTAYDLFTEVDIDGKKVTDFTKAKGSVITKINASYMNTLSAGSHTITAKFSDGGSASGTFTVKDTASGGSSSDKKPTTPVDNVVTCQMAGYPSNYSWNESAKACQPGYIDAGGTFHPYRTPSRIIPNTSDRDIMIHAWIAMLSITIGLFCGVKLLHEDWEV